MLQDIHRMKEVGNGPLTLKDRKVYSRLMKEIE